MFCVMFLYIPFFHGLDFSGFLFPWFLVNDHFIDTLSSDFGPFFPHLGALIPIMSPLGSLVEEFCLYESG